MATLLVDGFNLFYRWEVTRGFFRQSGNLETTLPRALSLFKDHLGRSSREVLVLLDGGVTPGNASLGGMKVEFAGPGRKADDLILSRVRRDSRPRNLLVVTSDRELGGNCRALGCRIESVEDLLKRLSGPASRRQDRSNSEEEKPAPPTGAELERWLTIFREDEDLGSRD